MGGERFAGAMKLASNSIGGLFGQMANFFVAQFLIGNKEQQQTVFFWKLLERLLNSLTELLGLEDTQGIVRDSSGGFPDRFVRIAEHVPRMPALLQVLTMV